MLLAATSESVKSSQVKLEKLLQASLSTGNTCTHAESLFYALGVFHIEILCHMKDWKQTLDAIQVAVASLTKISHPHLM